MARAGIVAIHVKNMTNCIRSMKYYSITNIE
ncbi:hypothetical protein HB959_00090 [Yersinia aleksiciae]|nr:hypothetical protein [Yersinia aleksiciae]